MESLQYSFDMYIHCACDTPIHVIFTMHLKKHITLHAWMLLHAKIYTEVYITVEYVLSAHGRVT